MRPRNNGDHHAAVAGAWWCPMQMLVRVVATVLLLVIGIGFTVYGALQHAIPVVKEVEEEVRIPVPMPVDPALPGGEGQSVPGGSPGLASEPPGMPGPARQPPPVYNKVMRKSVFATDEMEWRLIREASIGGVTLANSGKIMRTYSGDDAPALCPT